MLADGGALKLRISVQRRMVCTEYNMDSELGRVLKMFEEANKPFRGLSRRKVFFGLVGG